MMAIHPVKKCKNILDYIHGMMRFDSFFFKFIDTPQFQRLRDIKQLSTTQYIFPSANHSRLEHSFGVCFLANKFVKYLQQNQPECEINNNIIRSISLAGLCFNIGHGPYSSPFSDFCKEKLNFKWNQHEYAVKLFNNIIETEGIDPAIEDFDLNLTLKIIGKMQTNTTHWTEQIVNNTTNGIDVNIFDSLLRDSYKFGFSNQSYDYQILMNNSLILNDQICYRCHDAFPVFELFNSQHSMALKFYTHRVTNCIELMIKDIFIESSLHIDYLSKLNNINEYIDMTDNILNEITYNKSTKLSKAKELINRINKRDFYIFAGQYDTIDSKDSLEAFDENILLKYTSSNEIAISKDDLRVVKIKMNLGIRPGDPFKYVSFYTNEYEMVNTTAQNISQLLPNKFQEKTIIRICVTSKDEKKKEAAQKALMKYCNERGTEPILYKSSKKTEEYKSKPYSFDSITTKVLFKDDK